MSFHLKDDFKAGAPVSQVPAEWFNSVAKFLNNLCGGFGIRVQKPKPAASFIELDVQTIKDLLLPSSGENIEGKDDVNFGSTVTPLGSGTTADRSLQNSDKWDLRGFDDAAKVFVVSRVDKPQGAVAKLFFRELYITADGHVGGVGKETQGVEVI